MLRFALRHITAIIVIIAVAWWAIFYLPNTPTWAVLRLKQAIDAREGDAAAQYVDFDSVVKNAGQEMVKEKSGGDTLGALVGQAAVAVLTHPVAQLLESAARQRVENGDKDVQMPAVAVLGALVLLHHSDGQAWTNFKDHKGQVWKIHMKRESGRWKITQIENIGQILQKLEKHEEKELSAPPPASTP
jgi:Protein of unknown function (DUF2939)